ncbi:MAG: hypothetical protein A2096_15120 [Spirochaetes bacterium GWF1_41_5]|nr:MAG: hypothetical protein A2096_15120 [Spirochaetes bacterium GWF1_41_5]HBE04246.1 hypothetical protein [Spirochaetia bacterium]
MKKSVKKNILLVDNKSAINLSNAGLLKKSGYNVILAGSAREALALTLSRQIDLILMDIDSKNGMSGMTAAKKILACKNIPIIFQTKYNRKKSLKKIKKITIYGVILKNSGYFILQTSVEMALNLFSANQKILEKEEREQHVKKILLAIRNVNQLITMETDTQKLVHTACRILTENMGYFSAWIITIDNNNNINEFIHSSLPEASVKIINSAINSGACADLIKKQCSESRLFIIDKISKDHPACNCLIEKGQAVLMHRLSYRENCYGLLAVSVPLRFADDSEEQKLFIEVAGDIGFAFFKNNSEKALQASNERFQALFRSMKSGVAVYLPVDNGNDFILADFNKAAEKISRLKKENIIGKRLLDLFPSTEKYGILTGLKQVFHTGKPLELPAFYYKDQRLEGWLNNYFYRLPSGEIVMIFHDITAEKTAQEELAASNRKNKEQAALLESLFNAIPDILGMQDTQHRIIRYNKAGYDFFKTTEEESKGRACYSFIGLSSECEECVTSLAVKNAKPQSIQKYIPESGAWFEIRSYPVFDNNGNIRYIIEHMRDITEQRKAGEQIKKLLEEKELLLKEVHHRVKNNMAIIISLLTLQKEARAGSAAAEILADASRRIQSMMILYDKLYSSADYTKISSREFFIPLIEQISSDFTGKKILIENSIDDFIISNKMASSLGIIINELLVNAYKYAFPRQDSGTIKICVFSAEEKIFFSLYDNGVGIPAHISLEKTDGFGLKLVNMLARQINAVISLERINGTKISIEIPVVKKEHSSAN